jgi:hypothetical protein
MASLGGQKMSDGKQGERFSYTTEVINFILKAADCPSKFRPFLDILIGMAEGRVEFEASDAEVAGRYRGRGQMGATKQWASDKRKGLKEWQDQNGLQFVEYIHGGRDKDKYISTSYKLYLPQYAEQVEAEARKNEIEWKENRDSAIFGAALDLIYKLQEDSRVTLKKKVSTKGFIPSHRVTQQLNTARTLLKQAEELLEKYDFKPDANDKEIVEDIDKSITSIKERGFVENILDTIIFGERVED